MAIGCREELVYDIQSLSVQTLFPEFERKEMKAHAPFVIVESALHRFLE